MGRGWGWGGGSHLVAPSLSSSANIALEIARLEGESFNEEEAVREILARRGCCDRVVERTLLARVGVRREFEEEEEGAPLHALHAKTPSALNTSLATLSTAPRGTLYDTNALHPPSQGYPEDRARSASRRRAGSAEGGRGGGKTSAKVTAEDMLCWVRGKGPRAVALNEYSSSVGGYTPSPEAAAAAQVGGPKVVPVGESRGGNFSRERHPSTSNGIGGRSARGRGDPAPLSLTAHPVINYGSRTGRGTLRGVRGGSPDDDDLGTLLYNPVVRHTGTWKKT